MAAPESAFDREPPGVAPRIRIQHSSGAIYLLRTAQQHHVNLSAMADTKANIMIGVSALIFSILVGYSQTSGFTLPIGIMFVSTLAATTLAILAVMPSTKGPEVGARNFNPLFFGCFGQLSPHDFCREIEKVLRDDSSVYTAMALDIYGIGMVLYRRKYRYLAYSYRAFVSGFLLAFIAGAIAGWK